MGFLSNLFGGSRKTSTTKSSSNIENTTTNYVNDATANMDLWDSVGLNVSGGINAPVSINDTATAQAEIAAASKYATSTTATASQLMGKSIDSSVGLLGAVLGDAVGITERTLANTASITDSTLRDLSQRAAPNNLDILKPMLITIGGLGVLYIMGKK